MARLAYPELPITGPDADLVARISAARGGGLPNLFRMLLASPTVAAGWLDFMSATRRATGLDGRTRELAILQVAMLLRARYPEHDHVPLALQEGISPDEIDAIRRRDPHPFPPRERALLAYAAAMTLEVQVAEPVMADLRAHLDDREVVEVTVLVAAYNMVARFLEALQIDLEPR